MSPGGEATHGSDSKRKASGRMKGAVIASWEGFIIEAALSGEAEKFESGRAGWTGWRGGETRSTLIF